MRWHAATHFLRPNYPKLWGQCVVILVSVCSMHCRGRIVQAWSFVFDCFLSLFTCVFRPANICWHRLMGQLMDRCVNKFCSCKWSAVFSKRQNLVTGGSVPLCWSTFAPHERGCISGAGQPHGCNRNLQVQGSWSLNSLLTTFWCTFVFEATGLQSVLRKHESLRLLNWQWNAFNSHCILHASVEECAKAHLSRQSLTATFPLRGEMNGRLAFYTVLLCLCISLAIFFHLVYLVYFYTAQNMQEWCDESKRGVKPEAWHHFAFFLDGSWCWCDVMCKLDLMPLTFLALAIAVAKSQALRTDCQFGDFLKFGYSNSWMVYNVKCHWNGWFWSTPISGFPHLLNARREAHGQWLKTQAKQIQMAEFSTSLAELHFFCIVLSGSQHHSTSFIVQFLL